MSFKIRFNENIQSDINIVYKNCSILNACLNREIRLYKILLFFHTKGIILSRWNVFRCLEIERRVRTFSESNHIRSGTV